MKRFLTILAMLGLTGALVAADGWDKAVVGGSGARLIGYKSNIGLSRFPGNVGSISSSKKAAVNLSSGNIVVLASTAFNVTTVATADVPLSATAGVAGVVVTPPESSASVAYGANVDVATAGEVIVTSVPLTWAIGDLAGTSAVAGQITKTTTAGCKILQVLEVKTCTAADPYIRCRFLWY